MEPVMNQDKSDASALNLNESDFNFNEGEEGDLEDDIMYDNENSFQQNVSGYELDQSGEMKNASGYQNKSRGPYRATTLGPYNPRGFEIIMEDNENSSSQPQHSREESKLKSGSKESLTKKRSGESDDSLDGILGKGGDNSPFAHLDFRDEGEDGDSKRELNQFSFKLNPIEKRGGDITVDSMMRGSSGNKDGDKLNISGIRGTTNPFVDQNENLFSARSSFN